MHNNVYRTGSSVAGVAMSDKRRRRRLIASILRRETVGSQDQLACLLLSEGVECTQATLSRDLRDMGVHREHTADGFRYVIDTRSRYLAALREVVGMEILDVKHNGVMIVVRTLAGRAQGVAAYLDQQGDSRVLGTVAGDDTVFVAPADPKRIQNMADAIQTLAESG